MMLESTSCCGVYEINGLEKTPHRTIKRVSEFLKEPQGYWEDEPIKLSFIVFTDATKNKRGQTLATYIKRKKLGTVLGARARTNPNSGNKIKAWIWSPDIRKIKKHY